MTPEEYISKAVNYKLPREYARSVNKKHVNIYIYKTKPDDASKPYVKIDLVEASVHDDGTSNILMSAITYYIAMPYECEMLRNIDKSRIHVNTLTDCGVKRQYIVVSVDIV